MGRTEIRAYPLGQVGYLFEREGVRVLVDPYLSDSVAEQYGEQLRRLVPPTFPSNGLTEISWLLLTHAHLDHTDPVSLAEVLRCSPQVRVVCPAEVIPIVRSAGFDGGQIFEVEEREQELMSELKIRAIPAAHPRIERIEGSLRQVGYVLNWSGLTLYHAGDTIPAPEIFEALSGEKIDYAFLPMNERNYFRDEAGIVGNMTVREAFAMADRIGAVTLVPTHWDLFAPNSTTVWEIEALHAHLRPQCRLRFLPCGSSHFLESGLPS